MKFKVKRTSDSYSFKRKEYPPKGCYEEKDYFVGNFETIEDLLDFVDENWKSLFYQRKKMVYLF